MFRYFILIISITYLSGCVPANTELPEINAERFDIPLMNSPVKGMDNAPVTIIMFSDFNCRYCANAARTMRALGKQHRSDIRFVFKNFPTGHSQSSLSAAAVALAADRQYKFWEMYEALFKNQYYLGDNLYRKLALRLGLDQKTLDFDRNSQHVKKIIDNDIKLARQIGINSVPVFFINGIRVNGARSRSEFNRYIEPLIKENRGTE